MTEQKTCTVCKKPFFRKNRVSADRWRQQEVCSRACAVQSRERSKTAMNKHWRIQQARAAAKSRPPVISRDEEIAAIERHLTKSGATICPAPQQEADPMHTTEYRPQVQVGWRG